MDIHLLHKTSGVRDQGPLGPIPGRENVWQSGNWKIGEDALAMCIGQNIYLHEKQSEPSYKGGIIQSFRNIEEGIHKGRVVFEFKPTAEHEGVTQPEGWFLEKSIRNTASSAWSPEELQASVDAYAKMYRADQEGRKVNKQQIYRELEAKFGRRNKAFERRMMNISHVVKSLGSEPVKGLLPAGNIGANEAILATMIKAAGFLERESTIQAPTTLETDPARLDQKVNVLLKDWESNKIKIRPPEGLTTPARKLANSSAYERSPEVKAWVLHESGYNCECCGKAAPFKKDDGTPYLEVHHVSILAEGGPDTVSNTVAVCPDCHRALHYSGERAALVERLYTEVSRLERP